MILLALLVFHCQVPDMLVLKASPARIMLNHAAANSVQGL